MEKKNFWNKSRSILMIKNFETLDELNQFRKEVSNSGKNVHECVVMAIVESKGELVQLINNDDFTFVSAKQFNLFGILKNEKACDVFQREFDMVIVIGDLSKRFEKKVRKMNRKMRIGVNCANMESDINLSTEDTSPGHLINFVKQTLEKIE